MASQQTTIHERSETDTAMIGTTNATHPNSAPTPATRNANDTAPSHTSLAPEHYGDMTDKDDDDEDVTTRITDALNTLDNKWKNRWSTMATKLTTQ